MLSKLFFFEFTFLLFFVNISSKPSGSRYIFKKSERNQHVARHTSSEDSDGDHFHDNAHFDQTKENYNIGFRIRNVKGLYLCDNEKICENIDEYIVANNLTFDCNNKFLPIFYKYKSDRPNKSEMAYSFLENNKPELSTIQKTSKACMQIKRYIFFLIFATKNEVKRAPAKIYFITKEYIFFTNLHFVFDSK